MVYLISVAHRSVAERGILKPFVCWDLGLCKNLFACDHCCFLLVVSQHGCSLYLNSVRCDVFMSEVTFKYFVNWFFNFCH